MPKLMRPDAIEAPKSRRSTYLLSGKGEGQRFDSYDKSIPIWSELDTHTVCDKSTFLFYNAQSPHINRLHMHPHSSVKDVGRPEKQFGFSSRIQPSTAWHTGLIGKLNIPKSPFYVLPHTHTPSTPIEKHSPFARSRINNIAGCLIVDIKHASMSNAIVHISYSTPPYLDPSCFEKRLSQSLLFLSKRMPHLWAL